MKPFWGYEKTRRYKKKNFYFYQSVSLLFCLRVNVSFPKIENSFSNMYTHKTIPLPRLPPNKSFVQTEAINDLTHQTQQYHYSLY